MLPRPSVSCLCPHFRPTSPPSNAPVPPFLSTLLTSAPRSTSSCTVSLCPPRAADTSAAPPPQCQQPAPLPAPPSRPVPLRLRRRPLRSHRLQHPPAPELFPCAQPQQPSRELPHRLNVRCLCPLSLSRTRPSVVFRCVHIRIEIHQHFLQPILSSPHECCTPPVSAACAPFPPLPLTHPSLHLHQHQHQHQHQHEHLVEPHGIGRCGGRAQCVSCRTGRS